MPLTFRANLVSASITELHAAAHHCIALPDDYMIGHLDCVNVPWEVVVHLVCAVSPNDGDFARYPIGINHCT